MSNPTSLRLPDGLDDLIRGCHEASQQTDEIPAMSQAQVTRILLRDAGARLVRGEIDPEAIAAETDHDVDPVDLREIIPDPKVARFEREKIKDQGWLSDMRHGFEGRVRDQLRKRFRRGYDAEGIEERAQTWIAEARIYWQLLDDDDETFQEKVDYVEQKVEEYQAAYETSNYDPDDGWLSFDGVEEGEQEQKVESGEPVETARELILSKLNQTERGTTPDDARDLMARPVGGYVEERVADEHDLDDEQVDQAIDQAVETFATERIDDAERAAAADGGTTSDD